MAVTLTDAGLTILHDECCSWTSTKQKSTSVSVADIVGCCVVEKASKSDEARFCQLSILTKWTSSTSSSSSSSSTPPNETDGWVVFKPRRFIFEAAVSTADSGLDNFGRGQGGEGVGECFLAISKYGDSVRDLVNLIHAVRNVNDGDVLAF